MVLREDWGADCADWAGAFEKCQETLGILMFVGFVKVYIWDILEIHIDRKMFKIYL